MPKATGKPVPGRWWHQPAPPRTQWPGSGKPGRGTTPGRLPARPVTPGGKGSPTPGRITPTPAAPLAPGSLVFPIPHSARRPA